MISLYMNSCKPNLLCYVIALNGYIITSEKSSFLRSLQNGVIYDDIDEG